MREHLDVEGQERLDRELASVEADLAAQPEEDVDAKIIQLRQMGGEVIVV